MAIKIDCPVLRFDVMGFKARSSEQQSEIRKVIANAVTKATGFVFTFIRNPWSSWSYEHGGDGYYVIFPYTDATVVIAYTIEFVRFLAEHNVGLHGDRLPIHVRISIGYGAMTCENRIMDEVKWEGALMGELACIGENPRIKEQLKKVDDHYVIAVTDRFYAEYRDERYRSPAEFDKLPEHIKNAWLTDGNFDKYDFTHGGIPYCGYIYGRWLVSDTVGYSETATKPIEDARPINRRSASNFIKALDRSPLTLFFDVRQPMTSDADGLYPGWFSEPMVVHTALQVSAIRTRQHLLHINSKPPPFAGSPIARIHFVGDTKRQVSEWIRTSREFSTFIYIHEVIGIPLAIVPIDEFLNIIKDNADFFGRHDVAAALGIPASLPAECEDNWDLARSNLKDALHKMSSRGQSDQVWPSIDFAVLGMPPDWDEVWGAAFYHDKDGDSEIHYHNIPKSMKLHQGKHVISLDRGMSVLFNPPQTARDTYIRFATLMFQAIFTTENEISPPTKAGGARDPTARAINLLGRDEFDCLKHQADLYIRPQDDYKFVVE